MTTRTHRTAEQHIAHSGQGERQMLPAPQARRERKQRGRQDPTASQQEASSTVKSTLPSRSLKKKKEIYRPKTLPVTLVKSKDRGESCKAARRGPLVRTRWHGPVSPCSSPPGTTTNPGDNSQENPQRTGEGARRSQTGRAQHRVSSHLAPSKGDPGLVLPDPQPGNRS